MPEWLTALLAALLGGFLSLAGVRMQLQHQERQARASARASHAAVFARVLAIVEQYNPDRAQRMMEAQEPLPRGWDAEQILAPVRDGLATYAAENPQSAPETLELVRLMYAYFDQMPGIDHWEGERAVVVANASRDSRRDAYDRIGEIARSQLRAISR